MKLLSMTMKLSSKRYINIGELKVMLDGENGESKVTVKEEVVGSESDEQGNNQKPTTNSLLLREDETEFNSETFRTAMTV
nr:homeobox-leucine zipper protein ATHB-6-like isoform X3 [Ipomoea batatas]